MGKWRTPILVAITIAAVWFVKFYLYFPSADLDTLKAVLIVSSILFGFLAGFFISELWARYTSIRELQGLRSSGEVGMIRYAEHFFKNKEFEKDFKLKVEKAELADNIINWDEGHLEVPFFRNIGKSFEKIKVRTKKDSEYFNNLLDEQNSLVKYVVRLDSLYKDRLFASEWAIVIALSAVIALSVLFLETSHIFFQIVVLIFPAIIVLALTIIYDLDILIWGRGLITLGPSQRVFDAIGVKRFYLKKDLKFISGEGKEKSYRTEKDLNRELKKVYLKIMNTRKK